MKKRISSKSLNNNNKILDKLYKNEKLNNSYKKNILLKKMKLKKTYSLNKKNITMDNFYLSKEKEKLQYEKK